MSMDPPTFGDYDPEDAWDATDSVAEELRNLIERVETIHDLATGALAARAQRLRDDLAYVRERVLARDLG